MAAGFEGFEITWRKKVFDGAPQAGSAGNFGTLGINFRSRKPVDGYGTWEAMAPEAPPRRADEGQSASDANIDVQTLRGMLERGERVTVVDVRRAEDRAEWSIPGSIHFDAYDALNSGDGRAMEGLTLPEDAPAVTVCGRGRSSAVAAEQLRRKGLRAFSLEGGMRAWSLTWNTAEVEVPGTEAEIIQVRRTGKGCLSYLVAAGGEAAVVDAAVDPDVYVELAERRGWRIVHVLDTHVHADHLSRSRRLAEIVGAELHMPEGAPVSYPHSALVAGGTVEIGPSGLTAIHTPGHTPESASYLVDGEALLTGDTLFLSTVGRPDLGVTAGRARERARILFGSVRRLFDLPPRTLVLPGHTSEPVPFDGRPISAPLSEVREAARSLLEDEDRFVQKVAGGVSPTPENHERIAGINKSGEPPEGDPTELEVGANRCAAV